MVYFYIIREHDAVGLNEGGEVGSEADKKERATHATFRYAGSDRDPIRTFTVHHYSLPAVSQVGLDPGVCTSSDVERCFEFVKQKCVIYASKSR